MYVRSNRGRGYPAFHRCNTSHGHTLQKTAHRLELQELGRVTIALNQGPSMCIEFEPHGPTMRVEWNSSIGKQATLAKATVVGKNASIITNDNQLLDIVQKYTEKIKP